MIITELPFPSSLHTDVIDVLNKLEKLRAFRPTFTKAAGAALIVCTAVVWKARTPYQAPAPAPVKAKAAVTKTVPVLTPPALRAQSSGIAPAAGQYWKADPFGHAAVAPPIQKSAIAKAAPTIIREAAKKVSRVAALPAVKKMVPPPAKPAAPAVVADEDETTSNEQVDTSVVESFIESAPSEENLVVEVTTPLDEMTTRSFTEGSLSEDYHADTLRSAAQLDPSFTIEREFPREKRFVRSEGLVQRNEFTEIKEKLVTLKAEAATFAEAPPPPVAKPAPELVMPSRSTAKVTKPSTKVQRVAAAEPEKAETTQQPVPIRESETAAVVTGEPELVVPSPKVSRVKPVTAVSSSAPRAASAPQLSATKPVDVSPVLAGASTLASLAGAAIPATTHSAAPVAATQIVGPLATTALSASTQKSVVTFDARVDLPTKGERGFMASSAPQASSPSTAVAGPPPPPVALPTTPPVQVAQRGLNDDEDSEGDKLLVEPRPDAEMDRWLQEINGHFELSIRPAKSRDPRDAIKIDYYEYPERKFALDTSGLKGSYRLSAKVFGSEAPTGYEPVLSAPFNASDRRFEFPLRKADFDEAQARASAHQMTLTLFEGGSANAGKSKPVSGGLVRVTGFPGVGPFVSDAKGTVRIPQAPGRSEFMLEVAAQGYYASYPIVPTFGSATYQTIYLLRHQEREGEERLFDAYLGGYFSNLTGFLHNESYTMGPEQMAALKHYFSPRAKPANGQLLPSVVMGRVFDPRTRRPRANEEVSLLYRKGGALYFDSMPSPFTLLANPLDVLPDPLDVMPTPARKSTAENGLFGFFNIKASFRTLSRESGKPAYLFNLRPGSAQFIEFGRGGERAFRGRVMDPFTSSVPSGRVRLAGAKSYEAEIGDDGRFVLPDIDFPPGVITLEIEAKGYPTTWHTVPWDAHERETEQTLFLVPKESSKPGAPSIAWSKLRKDRGTVIGGGETSFFGNRKGCVFVSLEDTSGNKVASEAGPFPFTGTGIPKGAPLCLTRQRPGYVFFDLPGGEYILKWVNARGKTFRTHVVRVGLDRASVIVN